MKQLPLTKPRLVEALPLFEVVSPLPKSGGELSELTAQFLEPAEKFQRLGISERLLILNLAFHDDVAHREFGNFPRLCTGNVGDGNDLCRNVTGGSPPSNLKS